uniref:Uncharacterized protein n=1 Tax=Glossina palpalis gambiensis TaxID=67801 RepID=A0A1B0ARW1_9MUSC
MRCSLPRLSRALRSKSEVLGRRLALTLDAALRLPAPPPPPPVIISDVEERLIFCSKICESIGIVLLVVRVVVAVVTIDVIVTLLSKRFAFVVVIGIIDVASFASASSPQNAASSSFLGDSAPQVPKPLPPPTTTPPIKFTFFATEHMIFRLLNNGRYTVKLTAVCVGFHNFHLRPTSCTPRNPGVGVEPGRNGKAGFEPRLIDRPNLIIHRFRVLVNSAWKNKKVAKVQTQGDETKKNFGTSRSPFHVCNSL